MTQLFHSHQRDALANQVVQRINEYCRVTYDDGHRSHLGASIIGHKCERYLWYTFRWCMPSAFGGRMQRLFNRGHQTEHRFIEWLRGIGITVWDSDANGNQFRISGVGGHFGGSCDGVAQLPPEWNSIPDPILLEFKTYNAKGFAELVKNKSVKATKPQHYAQMCTYGRKMGLKYALYCAINKDNDDIYLEVVELDWSYGGDLERRAEHVITTPNPPPRLHENPTHIDCKFCDFHPVCHSSAAYEKNCRSCKHAQAVDGAQWVCTLAQQIIPKEVIPVGCNSWHPAGRQ